MMKMSIEKKMNQATKLTEQSERVLTKDLTRVYKQTKKEIDAKIAVFIAKYGVDGKLSQAESYKYNRLKNLEKEINELLGIASSKGNALKDNHLVNTDITNYNYTAYAIETEGQINLTYPSLSRKVVRETINTPLDNIAISNNKKQVLGNIQRDLAVGIAQGESTRKLSKRIQSSLETNANNALRIAQTEQTRVMNSARQKSMQHAENKGLEMSKVWVASLDDRTRSSHRSIDGEKQPLDKPYSNGLMFPGDQTGEASETINCRCVQITEIEGYPTEEAERRSKEGGVVPYKTYREWEEAKL